MESFWHNADNWVHIGGSRRSRVDAPEIKTRVVRVRAIGPRRFMVDGQVVPEGSVVSVSEHDAPMLVFSGKAELV